MLDELMVNACDDRDRAALEAEVDHLVKRHIGANDPASLSAAAAVLDGAAVAGGRRVRLWAAVLRIRASRTP